MILSSLGISGSPELDRERVVDIDLLSKLGDLRCQYAENVVARSVALVDCRNLWLSELLERCQDLLDIHGFSLLSGLLGAYRLVGARFQVEGIDPRRCDEMKVVIGGLSARVTPAFSCERSELRLLARQTATICSAAHIK